MGVSSEDSGLFGLPRLKLALWWSGEADGVLQRFERWAACARGYNRLRSARLSAGRMTMHEEPPDNRWSINRATQRLQIEGGRWAPSLRPHARQQPAAAAEQSRLRCRAQLGYRSNAVLDSRCLEAYSLDHSIYFKTIGELRSEKRSVASHNDNNNGAGKAAPPIDCGDFLSSDFDDVDEEDERLDEDSDSDLRDLDDADYERLAAGEVQLRRSALSEDRMNNNVMLLTGLRRKAAQ